MFKILYVFVLIFLLASCWSNDISELWISEEQIVEDNKDFEIVKKDEQRLLDIKSVQSAIEQYYQDFWEYPNRDNFPNVSVYLWSQWLPRDIRFWEELWNCKFWYLYAVWDDNYWLSNQIYKISTCVESDKYLSSSAISDWWINDSMIELWYPWYDEGNFKDKFYINDLDISLKTNSSSEKSLIIEDNNSYIDTNEDFINKYYLELWKWNFEYVYSITSWEMWQKDYNTFHSWYNWINNVIVNKIIDDWNWEYTITVTLYYEWKDMWEEITTKKRVIERNGTKVLETIKAK